MHKQNKMFQIILTCIFIVFCFLIIFPFWLLVSASLSDANVLVQKGYQIWPNPFDFSAYAYVFKNPERILRAYGVTFVFSITSMVLSVLLTAMIAYPLSRKHLRGRNVINFYLYFTMLFSGGLVASYMINVNILGLQNTYWALILPICCSSFYIIIMRTFFQTTVPEAIIESAKIDGARQLRIFVQIVLPISLPAIATIGLFFTFAYWNDWMMAKYYLNSNAQDLYPMQYVLISLETNIDFLTRNQQFMGVDASTTLPSETIRMAMVMVSVIPIACSYPFFQKYFISGLTIGAVKG